MATVIGGPAAGLVVPDGQTAIWVEARVNTYLGSGGRYVFNPPNAIIWQAFGAGQGAAFTSGVHQLDAAWRRLMRAYGVTMPRALRRSAAGRSRMKRVVR